MRDTIRPDVEMAEGLAKDHPQFATMPVAGRCSRSSQSPP